ncbi:TraI domain-containing protein [Salmonella enterica]|uniref:DNA-binding domain-containing protein n=1 Tax=Salmonella enterica TaxID=28901 RepID=A0A403T7A7_SALER|nr:hypothetical protein [Salmonella enterica subsp. diarizonae]EDL3493490.1 hypothetical protein [Salmonella enterica subsp. enterica serovar Newport]EGW7919372.1 DNA-binding domain-containing protein [Salmonella enterica]ECJ2413950.1 hypothetical protein [Salmonella enterica subsp. diarizonae]EHI5301808.1 DNA-binding domain-containing protein [Salmonella enterica]
MWRKLFGFRAAGKGKVQSPEARGYLRPLTALEILDTENRQGLLKQIRDNSLMTKEGTEKYYLQPLRHCVNLMQQLPATEKEHHAVMGGLVDFTLKRVAYALRLSRGYMLPQGAGAEEQSAQAATWNAVIFYVALCRSLTVFGQLEGELDDGSFWNPGLSVPSRPYRLRFCQGREERAQAVLLGMRLLPEDVVIWLGRTPAALDTLLRIITGEERPGCVVSEIISEASVLAGGQLAGVRNTPQPVVPEPVLPAAAVSVVAPGMVVPATWPEQATVAAPAPGMVLGSALDGSAAAGTGNTVVPPTPQPASVPEEPADQTIGDVMALMGFSTENTQDTADAGLPVEAPGNKPDKQPCVPEYVFSEDAVVSQVEGPTDDENYGAQFLSWLLEQINTGTLTVNNSDSSLHVVSGLLFAPVPEIFRGFLRENKMQPRLRKKIQEDFESLNVHYAVKGKGLYSFQKYPEEGRVGDPEALFGYLIKIRKIMPAFSVSKDSQYLFIANKYNM